MSFRIGLLLFPDITQLDMTGPYEVFTKLPDAEVHLVWKTLEPVAANGGMKISPTTTFAACPQLDLVCVPGGPGMNALLNDEETLSFLRRQARDARYVTSVCTGALVLGAAGLLKGRRAATHWMSRDMLRAFGATPVAERVVIDGNVVTGGGVTAGIDFALTIAAEAFGEDLAKVDPARHRIRSAAPVSRRLAGRCGCGHRGKGARRGRAASDGAGECREAGGGAAGGLRVWRRKLIPACCRASMITAPSAGDGA